MNIKPLYFWGGIVGALILLYLSYNKGYDNGLSAGVKAVVK